MPIYPVRVRCMAKSMEIRALFQNTLKSIVSFYLLNHLPVPSFPHLGRVILNPERKISIESASTILTLNPTPWACPILHPPYRLVSRTESHFVKALPWWLGLQARMA